MNALPVRFGLLLPIFSGWVNRRRLSVVEYLLEENRLLRGQLEGRRLRLTDDQRRRLAVKGKVLGRRVLGEVAGIVTPYLEHYHRERPHQGLRNELLVPHEGILPTGSVKRRQRLGGLLNFYYHEAA
jgi:hypothetical protein